MQWNNSSEIMTGREERLVRLQDWEFVGFVGEASIVEPYITLWGYYGKGPSVLVNLQEGLQHYLEWAPYS